MKNSWNGEFMQGMQELPEEEASKITGGESIWYWIGYAAGSVVNMFSNTNPTQNTSQK